MGECRGINRKRVSALLLAMILMGIALFGVALADGEDMNAPKAIALNTPVQGVVGAFEDLGGFYRYTLPDGLSQLVTVRVTSERGPLCVYASESAGAGRYQGSSFPFIYEYREAWRGGTHYVWVARDFSGDVSQPLPYTITVMAEPITGMDEQEPNDDFFLEENETDSDASPEINPNVLPLGPTPLKGVIDAFPDPEDPGAYLSDFDHFRFQLVKDSVVKVTLKAFDHALVYMIFPAGSEDFFTAQSKWQDYSAPLTAPVSSSRKFTLEAGEYALCIYTPQGLGRYEISMEILDEKPRLTLSVSRSAKVTAGFLLGEVIGVRPDYAYLPVMLQLSSSKPEVVDVLDGWPFALKLGSSVVTFDFGPHGKYKCKVSVLENKFSRTKPLSKKAKNIYTSAKKLSYDKNGNLQVEVFVLNKTGKTIRSISDMVLELWSGDGVLLYEKNVGAMPLRRPLLNGAFQVYKAKITPAEFQDYRYDLRIGDLTATIDINASEKAGLKAKTMPLVEDSKGGVVERRYLNAKS